MNSVITYSIFFFGIDRSTRVGKVSKRQEKVVVAETTATWGENFRKRSKPTRRTENFSNIKSPFIDGSSHVSSEVLLVPKSRTIGKSDHLTLPKDCAFSAVIQNPRERPLLKLPSSVDSREGLLSGPGYILVFLSLGLTYLYLFRGLGRAWDASCPPSWRPRESGGHEQVFLLYSNFSSLRNVTHNP